MKMMNDWVDERTVPKEEYKDYLVDQFPIEDLIRKINPKFDSEYCGGAHDLDISGVEFGVYYEFNKSVFHLAIETATYFQCVCDVENEIDRSINCQCDNYPIKKIRLIYKKDQVMKILKSNQLNLF